MTGFFKKLKEFFTSKPDFIGDYECFYICNKCPKCGSYHIEGKIRRKTINHEESYNVGDYNEKIVQYWLDCDFRCLDCGYTWQDSGIYDEQTSEEIENEEINSNDKDRYDKQDEEKGEDEKKKENQAKYDEEIDDMQDEENKDEEENQEDEENKGNDENESSNSYEDDEEKED